MAVVETLIFALHIILILIASSEDGSEKDITYTLSLFYLTLIIMIFYLVFSILSVLYHLIVYISR
jgi:hypothetical protein